MLSLWKRYNFHHIHPAGSLDSGHLGQVFEVLPCWHPWPLLALIPTSTHYFLRNLFKPAVRPALTL